VRLDPPEGAGDPSAAGNLGTEGADAGAGVALADAGAVLTDAGAPASPDDAGGPLFTLAFPPPEPCPGNEFGGSCYEFFAEFVSWSDGEDLCVAWGGHLASVQSPAENAFLDGWPAQVAPPASNGPGIWLGGTDAAEDGAFLWSDGSAMGFARFAPNQPDNGVGIDCIEKRSDTDALWYDQRCTDERPYVCERSL